MRPGFFARLLVAGANWRLRTDDADIVVERKSGARRVPVDSLEDVIVRRGVLWATLDAPVAGDSPVVLPGLRPSDANQIRANFREWFSERAVAEVGAKRAELAAAAVGDISVINAELDEFYARDIYLSARDADLWLDSRAPELLERLEKFRQLTSHPMFAEWAVSPEFMSGGRRFRDLSLGERTELRKRNEEFVVRETAAWSDFFDRVEKTPLTGEQRRAAVVMENRNLLVAAAGSGKTSAVVGKIGYALKKGLCRPSEIIALAFNNKAAEELRERIRLRLGECLDGGEVEAMTFHALGLGILGEATGAKPRTAEWAANLGENFGRKTGELVGNLAAADPDFFAAWANLLSVFRWQMKPRDHFKGLADYDRHLEGIGAKERGREKIPTLKGDSVKSLEECLIANYLFVNGVEYEYERDYEHDTSDSERGQYRPDFYYPRANVYHEHFALNARGKAPAFMGGDEYVRGAEWKRELHAKKGTRLIETTSAMFHDGDVFEHLREELARCGALEGADPLSPDEVAARLRDHETRPIYSLMATFLSHWKSGGRTRDDLSSRLNRFEGFARARARAFLDVMLPFRDFYDKRLRDNNEVDFDDMLIGAAEALRSGSARRECKLILADEFQDISRARAELLRALLEQNPDCKLFAVGDDWQAIYRFAGADVFIMTNFADEFGAAESNQLTRTFRSNQGIADVASRFVRTNPEQIEKEVRADDPSRAGVVNVVRYHWDEHESAAAESKLAEIAALAKEAGERRSVFILARYNRLLPEKMSAWKKRFAESLDVSFLTMHRAKGLEADYVVVLGMNEGRWGFPNGMEDDPVLELVMPRAEKFEFAEERRLFYVALTRARRKVYLLARRDRPSRFVEEIVRDGGGEVLEELADESGATTPARRCPKCGGGFLVEREGRHGLFHGCSAYPDCDYTRDAKSSARIPPRGPQRTRG